MLKRCLSPLTLVNQVALIVLLSTAIGLAGMAVSGWLVQGVQGSAHAINKAGSLRMQSYRLLAAVPLSEKDKPLIKEMEQTAFSAELTRAAERDGQLAQLQGLQDYWRNELIPALIRAQNRETVSADVSQFVAGLDQLVGRDHGAHGGVEVALHGVGHGQVAPVSHCMIHQMAGGVQDGLDVGIAPAERHEVLARFGPQGGCAAVPATFHAQAVKGLVQGFQRIELVHLRPPAVAS